MNLYEIKGSIETLLSTDFVDEETGEINESALLKLNELEETETEKLEGIGCYIKNLLSESESIKSEIDNLKARADSKTKKADSLKRYISDYMLTVGKSKFETSKISLSFRKSKALEITDQDEAFKFAEKHELLKFKEPDIDKKGLKALIESGVKVKGAEVVEKKNIQVK